MLKNVLKSKMIEVSKMSGLELFEFEKVLSMSDIDEKAKSFLNKSVDLRRTYLEDISVSVEAVCADFDYEKK